VYRADQTIAISSTIAGRRWVLAVIECFLIRVASECGPLVSLPGRGERGLVTDLIGPRTEQARALRTTRDNSIPRMATITTMLAVTPSMI
jgi:hypothetical protein